MKGTAPPRAGKTDSDLPGFLAERARGASDARLAADATIGFIGMLTTMIVPSGFGIFVFLAGACFFSFGVWGIADRELGERGESVSPRMKRALRLAQILATVLGGASAAALAVAVMAILIGRVIS